MYIKFSNCSTHTFCLPPSVMEADNVVSVGYVYKQFFKEAVVASAGDSQLSATSNSRYQNKSITVSRTTSVVNEYCQLLHQTR